jgi:hypothetical protein
MLLSMQHHRLELNGPPDDVAALASALHAAGAQPIPGADPPRLTWTTPAPSPLHGVCARHPRVVVGAERFALLGETLDRVVLRGAEATVLERRPFAPHFDGLDGDGDADDGDPILHGLALAEDCAPLDPDALGVAGRRVAAHPVRLGPGPAGSALDDALLVGAAVGRLCAVATADPRPGDPAAHALSADPRASARPSPAVLTALVDVAAAALTAGAACADPACAAELAYERARHLTEAYAIAAVERLWSRPGDADWPEWLMYTLLGAVAVVEDCATTLHQPPPPLLAVHLEHAATQRERLCHGTTRLVATCLQALVLFAAGASP